MTFRQFGGLKYNAKHNVVSSNFNTSNNLVIREDAGISNNLKVTNDLLVQGNTDICGNLTAYNMFLSSGNNYSTEPNAVVPKSYVDTIATGLQILSPVPCISTYDNSANTDIYPVPIYPYNVTSYYPNGFVINGYPVQLGDSILLNDQGDHYVNAGEAVNNGVYDLSYNNTDYYFIRSTTELSLGSNAKGAYIKTTGGTINGGSGWVQVRSPAIVGIDPLLFYAFNPSSSSGYTPGIGLYTSQQGTTTYLNVDYSLNFLTGIDASGGETLNVGTNSSIVNLGSIDTSVNIAGNPYVYTPYSLGSTFSPQVINITSTPSSTKITFNWSIPQLYQNISSSFQNINATLYADISGNINTYQILNNNVTNINTLNNIIVTNQSSSNGFINNTTYNYYNPEFSYMQDSTYNQLILWYSNYSPYPNVSYAGYTKFASIGTPGRVFFNYGPTPTTTSPASVNSLFNVTDGTLSLPCYVEVVDTSNPSVEKPPYITNYQSNYTTPGSSNRYITPYNTNGSEQTFTAIANSGSYQNTTCVFQNMYPDCSYSFFVQAKNGGNPSYGNANDPSYNYSTPAPSYPPTTKPSSLFNTNNYKYINTGYFVSNNTEASPILNINNFATSLQSDNIITPVQQSGIYGNNSLSSSLNVTAAIVHNSQTNSASVNVLSFGNGSSSFTNTSGGINVTGKTFDAYYNGGDYNKGFYLDCSTNMTITQDYFSSFTTNNNLYEAKLTCNGNGVDPSSNYSFYADNITSIPSFNYIQSFTINSTNNYYSNQVSGIWVLNQSKNPVFSVTNLQLNNMGDYFYASPLVTYNITGGAILIPTESTVTNNITTITNGKFSNPITINNNNLTKLSSSVSPSYQTNISLSITFNNLFGQNSALLPNISVICDQPSYNLITNTLATSIQNLGTSVSGYKGYRVWSANVDSGIPGGGTMDPSGIVPYPYIIDQTHTPNNTTTSYDIYTGSGKGYLDISYNNVWNISLNSNTNQELLIANGNFTTNSTYYKDYSLDFSGNGNLNNYSGLSGKKYATFVWDVNSSQSNIYFQIQFTNSLTQFQNYYYYDSNHTKQLELYYRFEYKTDVTTTSWGEIGSTGTYYPNTTWISINSTTTGNSGVPNDKICNSSNIKNVYWNPASITSNTYLYTFKAQSPVLYIVNNARLYLRIGMPDNVTNNFSSVNCYYSS